MVRGVLAGLVVARLETTDKYSSEPGPKDIATGDVHIRTPPSWLPVANMKVSQEWFQATHVRSPPTVCARM